MVDESLNVIMNSKPLNDQFGKLFVLEEEEDQVIIRFYLRMFPYVE
jgi:hypothetical protein